MSQTTIEFPYVIVLESGSGPTQPTEQAPWDGAAYINGPASGEGWLRNQTRGTYHAIRIDLADGVASVGCVASGLAFGSLPLPSFPTAPTAAMNCVLNRVTGQLFGRASNGLWYEVMLYLLDGVAAVGCSTTGVPFESLPPYQSTNGTPIDGWSAVFNPSTGRLFLRARNATSNHYHEMTIADVDGVASVGVLTVGQSFSTITS